MVVMVTARIIQDAPRLHTRTAQISVVTFIYVTVVNCGYSVLPTGTCEHSPHVPLPFLEIPLTISPTGLTVLASFSVSENIRQLPFWA